MQAILKATPGKPGKITFSSNLLLNLAQQLIAAELNLARGASAPTKVLNAINAQTRESRRRSARAEPLR